MAKGGTPAVAAAERAAISFTIHEYDHHPGAAAYGIEAAQALGLAAERVFKTLVARLDGTSFAVAVIPVAERLSLKALAAAAGAKRAELAVAEDAERVTGYVVGGISPLGQKRALPTYVDLSALQFETVFVSAGRRGMDIEIAPGDLLRLTGGAAQPLTV